MRSYTVSTKQSSAKNIKFKVTPQKSELLDRITLYEQPVMGQLDLATQT